MNQQVKKILQLLVIFAIGGAFLYFVFKGTNWAELAEKIVQTNYYWISIGMLVSVISHWMRAYRGTMLYQAMSYKVGTLDSMYAVFIGYFINYFIPRGGEVARCVALSQTNDVPVEKGLGTIITERLVDMVLLVLILGLVFLLQFDLIYSYIDNNLGQGQEGSSGGGLKYILGGILLVGFVIIWLLRKKLLQHPLAAKVLNKVKGLMLGLTSIRQVANPTLFWALSVGIWLCYILMMYFCLFALPSTAHLGFSACLTVFALGTIGVVIPAPGAGAGTYHFAVMQGLLLFNVAKEEGIAYATIVHGAQMVMFIVLGGISTFMVFIKHKRKQQVQGHV